MRAMERRDQTERVAVFVDGANLYHSIKSYYKGVLDYDRLLEAAVGDRSLLRATFYIVEKQEADDAQEDPGSTSSARSFVYNLNKFGYKVRSKPLHGPRNRRRRRREDRLPQGRLGRRASSST